MSNFNDPNLAGEPIREVDEVVVEEETTYRVDPTYPNVDRTYVAPVEETRSFWSRFWWLIPLLALLIALPFILRGCNRDTVACTSLSDTIFTSAQRETTVNTLDQWIPGIAADHRAEAETALRDLCNARLSFTGSGNWYDNNAIANAFHFITGGIDENAVNEIRGLVNGGTFCRCA